jgi:hypothetical protein
MALHRASLSAPAGSAAFALIAAGVFDASGATADAAEDAVAAGFG